MIQDQFQAHLVSEEVLDLEIIDKKITQPNSKTFREKIIRIKKKGLEQDRLLVAMERHWNGQGYEIYYSTIHKEEALE